MSLKSTLLNIIKPILLSIILTFTTLLVFHYDSNLPNNMSVFGVIFTLLVFVKKQFGKIK